MTPGKLLTTLLSAVARQNIGGHVFLARQVANLEAQLTELLKPTCLTCRQMGLRLQVLQRLMVGVDQHILTLQVAPPFQTCTENSHELKVRGAVAGLSAAQLL